MANKFTKTAKKAENKAQIPDTPMRFIWYIVRPYRTLFAFTIFFTTLGQTLSVVLPYILKILVDATATAETTVAFIQALSFWGMVFIGIMTVMFLSWRASDFFGIPLLARTKADSFQKLYDYVVLHSHTYFSNRFAGSVANKISHASDGSDNMLESVVWTYYPTMLTFFGMCVLLFMTDARLGYIYTGLVLILFTVNVWLVKRRRPIVIAYAESASVLRGVGVDLITNISAVRQFDRRPFERVRLAGYIDDRTKKDIARDVSQSFGLLINNVIVIFAMMLMMFVLYTGVQNGFMSTGDVVLVISLLWNTSYQLIFIGNMLNNFIRIHSEIEEGLQETLIEHEIIDGKNAKKLIAKKGEILWNDVTFGYEGNTVFDNFNLTIKPGERIGLVGSSGAGKTTFVSLLLRQHELNSGAIVIDGQDISQVTQDSLRENVAVVPQEPMLFHRSIRENIMYGKPKAIEKEVIAVAKKAQAHEFIASLPRGYDTLVGERGVKLSGGQKQRVAIARAMLKDSKILVLDEATSALDSESEVAIQKALHKLMEGKTVIAIAHRLSTLREMDRIIVLENGKIIEDGTHDELTNNGGLYARLWEHQAGGFLLE